MTRYTYENIKTIHLEITDKCNASCPQCGRNKMGGEVNPFLSQTELTIEDIRRMFEPRFVQQLKRLYMCGNYGDPIVAKDTLTAFKYFRNINHNMTLGMNTNGSARTQSWWRELASIIGENGYVRFGIDGLSDTHHLYRKDTNFGKIMENARTFIDAGGKAHWDFIVFKHNEDQVDRAESLAASMGFSSFQVKKTGRFFSNTKNQGKDEQPVHDKNGKILYKIEKPTIEKYQNNSLLKENQLKEKYGSFENYLDNAIVDCKTLKENSIYVSAEGLVFPCCWTANQLYLWYMPEKKGQMWDMINETVKDTNMINAKLHNFKQIVDGRFFRAIQESWTKKSIKDGKLKVCAKTCGNEFDQFKDQYK